MQIGEFVFWCQEQVTYLSLFDFFIWAFYSFLESCGNTPNSTTNFFYKDSIKRFCDKLLEIWNHVHFYLHQYRNFQFNQSYLGLQLEMQVQKPGFLEVFLNCTQRRLFYFQDLQVLLLQIDTCDRKLSPFAVFITSEHKQCALSNSSHLKNLNHRFGN